MRQMKLQGTSPVAGGRVAHQVEGPRGGIPLILLQGQANSHVWWRAVRPLLTERFLTITFDYRGTGATARLQAEAGQEDASTWSTRSFAEDAAAVLSALGVQEALVYGTSMGGRIAQELAIARPGLVSRLVLACTTPGGRLAQERSRQVRMSLADPDREVRHRALVDVFYTPGWVRTRGGYDRVPTRLLGDPGISPRDANRHLRMSARHDASDRLQLIKAPTLVLHGTDDVFAPVGNATVLGERIAGSRVRIFPGGRHGFFDEFAPEVTDLVTEFLTSPQGHG
jgi:pimeloyl-ACP methyl ester carboxylesterase